MKNMTMTALATVTLLGACGGSGSNPFEIPEYAGVRGDVTVNEDGSYTIVDGDTTVELAAASVSSNGAPYTTIGGTVRATSFGNDDVTLIAGISDGAAFSGIVGTAGAAPTGSATFQGSYTYMGAGNIDTGAAITLEYDFADNDLETIADPDTGLVSKLDVDGQVASDGTLYGTVEYDDNDVETGFTGGFYGDTVGGVFDSEEASGLFYGTKQ